MDDGLVDQENVLDPYVLGGMEGGVMGGRHVKNARGTVGAGAPPKGDVRLESSVEDGRHFAEVGAKMLGPIIKVSSSCPRRMGSFLLVLICC